jgi:hypothetical protein
MIAKLNKLILLLMAAAALAISAAGADTLSSGSYTVNDTIPCGGQALTSGSYTVYDLKGQPLAGSLTSGSYTVQLGGLYGLVGGVISKVGVPAGTVPLTISRSGNDIKIAWDPSYVNPQIFFMTGDGTGKYQSDNVSGQTAVWALYTTAPAGQFDASNANSTTAPYILHKNQVGQGAAEAYYKGLQSTVSAGGQTSDQTSYPGKTYLATALTAGKVNLAFPAGYTLFELPVWLDVPSLPNAIGDQLTVSAIPDELYDYYMNKASYSSGAWVGVATNFEKARGYYLRILNSPKTLTFVGNVKMDEADLSLKQGYSMIGNPYPISKDINAALAGASAPDELYDRYANKKTYTTAWVGADFKFGLASGFWYRRMSTSPYSWKLIP